jgi:hypothetical protein
VDAPPAVLSRRGGSASLVDAPPAVLSRRGGSASLVDAPQSEPEPPATVLTRSSNVSSTNPFDASASQGVFTRLAHTAVALVRPRPPNYGELSPNSDDDDEDVNRPKISGAAFV